MMKFLIPLFFIFQTCAPAFAANAGYIDANGIKNMAHTRTWAMPNATGTISCIACTETLSNKTVQAANGTISTPSISFVNNTDSGLYRVGAGEIGLSITGFEAIDLKPSSSGSFGNIGMGGAASVSPNYIVLEQRDTSIVGGFLNHQLSNPSTTAGYGSQFQVLSDGGNNYLDIASIPSASAAPDIYAGGGGVIRFTTAGGSSTDLVLVTDASASSSIRFYAGGDASGNKIATMNSNGLVMNNGNVLPTFVSIATAAAATTLTVGSAQTEVFTGSTTQQVNLPVASTLPNNWSVTIQNTSSGVVTVKTSGANTIQAMGSNTQLVLTCINPSGGTGTASWNWAYQAMQNSLAGGGSVTSITFSSPLTGGTISTSGTVGLGTISPSIGGLGLNASASNGVPLFTAGSVAIGSVSSTYGGTGLNTSASTGYPSVSSGTWSIASAAATFVTLFETIATTGGDLIYGGASGTPTRLANGTVGQVLTSAGGTAAPTWSNAVAFYANTSASTASGSTPFIFSSTVTDTASGYNAGTGQYTVAKAGFYTISTSVYSNSTSPIVIYLNGVSTAQSPAGVAGSSGGAVTISLHCAVNDVIDIRPVGTQTATGGSALNFFSIVRVGN